MSTRSRGQSCDRICAHHTVVHAVMERARLHRLLRGRLARVELEVRRARHDRIAPRIDDVPRVFLWPGTGRRFCRRADERKSREDRRLDR